jgi:drug/metabolite transporter superfamily protein YnfA
MWTIPTYILAAFAEIGGCFAFWGKRCGGGTLRQAVAL